MTAGRWAVLCAALFMAAHTVIQAAEPPAPQEVESFETVQPATQHLTALTVVGRIHPALVHFPIGILMALVFLDGLTFFFHREEMRPAGHILLGLTLLSFVVAGATGFLLATEQPPDAATQNAIANHRNVMLSAFGLSVVAAILRFVPPGAVAGARKFAYLGFMFVAAALVLFGGHLGGRLVFGEGYLPF